MDEKRIGYTLKPIPTFYSGVKFRSKLEANYAAFFDTHNIKWEYGVQGFDLEGMWYLPDFWLSEINTFFEVKGVLTNIEKPLKMAKLVSEDNIYREIMVLIGDRYGMIFDPLRPNTHLSMAKCAKCNKYWFFFEEEGWACRHCGEYDGSHHLRDISCNIEETPVFEAYPVSKRGEGVNKWMRQQYNVI